MNLFKRKTKSPADIEIRDDGDMWGQLSRASWSCVVLDGFGELLKHVGLRGKELYFRMAQQAEAFFTTFEGEGEDVVLKNVFEFYVWPNVLERNGMFERMDMVEVPISKLNALVEGFFSQYEKYIDSKRLEVEGKDKQLWDNARAELDAYKTYFLTEKSLGVAKFWNGYWQWHPDAVPFLSQIPVKPLPTWWKIPALSAPHWEEIVITFRDVGGSMGVVFTSGVLETFTSQLQAVNKVLLDYILTGAKWE